MRPTHDPDIEPLELLVRRSIQTTRQARREVARSLLALARSDRPLDDPVMAGDLAAAFLRRYAGRTATQEAYSRDLADWFVWLDREGVRPFDATLRHRREVHPHAAPERQGPPPRRQPRVGWRTCRQLSVSRGRGLLPAPALPLATSRLGGRRCASASALEIPRGLRQARQRWAGRPRHRQVRRAGASATAARSH